MNSDSYFEIGSTHLVCQDYALSGNFKDIYYGIVSDGCSSAEHSEIGAQILCHVARYNIQLYCDLFFSVEDRVMQTLLGNSILKRADELRKCYPIVPNALEATLLIMIAKRDQACVFGWGDGYVLLHVDNQTLSYQKISYPETNAPFYLSATREEYLNKFGSGMIVKYTIGTLLHGECDGDIPSFRLETFDTPFYQKYLQLSSGDSLTIMTDGLGQYQNDLKKPVPDIDIMPLIVDYPNVQGAFAQRTMNFLKRDLLKKNWSHLDDIGLATIVF